ncbi:MAG TPA: DNA-formamidopyrimidine glycosylase family protein, partial [Actinomycetota bacterium]|nr:DNA-formamidopyrimidine glycosylase family protein [Actinomycetota bacterium]
MPEGDAVHLTARRLHAALADKVVTRSDLRSPRFATADLRGQTVTEVVARGKHLLLRTDDGLTLHTHLKMDGVWRLYWPGERWREPTFQARAIVEVPDRQAVGFRLAIVELLRTDREGDVLGHLGPDVLGPDWDPDEALRRLTGDPAREIGEALVDQRVMAGPGNVYKSEALFLRGIHPRTPVGRVG